jgi:hypothetical protein
MDKGGKFIIGFFAVLIVVALICVFVWLIRTFYISPSVEKNTKGSINIETQLQKNSNFADNIISQEIDSNLRLRMVNPDSNGNRR